jgi:hypothetical protein
MTFNKLFLIALVSMITAGPLCAQTQPIRRSPGQGNGKRIQDKKQKKMAEDAKRQKKAK